MTLEEEYLDVVSCIRIMALNAISEQLKYSTVGHLTIMKNGLINQMDYLISLQQKFEAAIILENPAVVS